MQLADVVAKLGDKMKLGALLSRLKKSHISGEESIDISDLAYHSGKVKPGSCFVAIRGLKVDGHRFVADAIARGAEAVVVEQDIKVPDHVSKIVVEDTRDALARMSSVLFGEPTKEIELVGITGTNGKTTIATLIHHIWQTLGVDSGLITTIAYQLGKEVEEATRTTPESYDLQKMFGKMSAQGIHHCVMEVTSHALALKRVVDCHFDGVVFTNLSEDHLDYHKDMESYFAAKAKLFRERLVVSEKKKLWAVLNWDDPYGKTLAGGLPAKVWRYSLKNKVEIFASQLNQNWFGMRLTVETPQGSLNLNSPLIGHFNASNILAAVASSLAMQLPFEVIQEAIQSFQGVRGRMEKVGTKDGASIFVDYAHTPDALENVLKTLRLLNPKRIVTLFGCGGDRDSLKRPRMGKIVEALSDKVIVTSDNPRNENPVAIIQDILKGLKNPQGVCVIENRREAIEEGLKQLGKGDCFLIAGKGHEIYQEVGGVKHPFDDRKIVEEFLNGV